MNVLDEEDVRKGYREYGLRHDNGTNRELAKEVVPQLLTQQRSGEVMSPSINGFDLEQREKEGVRSQEKDKFEKDRIADARNCSDHVTRTQILRLKMRSVGDRMPAASLRLEERVKTTGLL